MTRLSQAMIVVCLGAPLMAQEQPLRGFSPQRAAQQRDLEKRFRAIPQPERLREYMGVIAAEPHHAGSAGSRKVAEYILGKFREWGLPAEIEEFEALMPTPKDRALELIEPGRYRAQLREPVLSDDQDSSDANQLPTFNAYSADGDVTAQLVYVNYGRPEDYEELAKMKVDVKGKIVIARYGASWRGIKPKVAFEHGAAGCLIYSDPKDDGFYRGDVYPGGAYRPEHGVQRGSVMDRPIHPGDPLTPGWAGDKGGKKLSLADAKTIMKIPVQPISYADALPLLRQLKGPVAPEAWRGALPVTYHVGPGPAIVRLRLAYDWQVRPLYNVVVRIPGRDLPDQWIVRGNHHDAWVNGASDPTSGNVALMEEARALGELLKSGWRPRRTLILASWDAEEWGLIGSTEWAEKHAAELDRKAVIYINSDSSGKGRLGMGGSHSLERFFNEVARDITDPETGKSLWQVLRDRQTEQARTEEAKKDLGRADLRIAALGSGSDYTPFLQHLGIASANLGFGGEGGGGVYHSIYDSFAWYTRFSDSDFTYGRALAQTIGTAMLRLAQADVLPFEFNNVAETLGRYVEEVEKLAKDAKLDFTPLRSGLEAVHKSATNYEAALQRSGAEQAASPDLDQALIRTERALMGKGLPRRTWYRHRLYAPGFYTGYAVKTLPGVREAIEQKQWEEARSQITETAEAFTALAAAIDAATLRLTTGR
jgi:N-acetylated-alpha-linked acidic dipeptidase